MSKTKQHRFRSESFDEYCRALELVKPFGMTLKQLRTLETIILNVIVGAVALAAIYSGAEPTVVGLAALTGLGLLNGIKVSEWAAAAEVLAEARAAAVEREQPQDASHSSSSQEDTDYSNK
jgi:hypothetical protein